MGDAVARLDRDVYGMGQVDRLLGLSRGTACRWIDGYERGALLQRCVGSAVYSLMRTSSRVGRKPRGLQTPLRWW